jgi:NAD(P)-dependent dehydrogenase (short-subunit alcohol dehydrogenase family)
MWDATTNFNGATLTRGGSTRRRILVTGSSRGLGAAIAGAAAERGWDVLGLARSGAEMCDVRDFASVQACLTRWRDNDPGLDLLVCCASSAVAGRFEHVDPQRLRDPLRVDLEGSITAIKAALPLLRTRADATVVIVSSMAGLHGIPGFATYSAAKAGVRALAQALALEWRDEGPRVILLVLGTLEGDGIRETPSWTAAGEGRATPARPFKVFRAASTPLALTAVADVILGDFRRSKTVYLPRSLAILDALARHAPGLFRVLIRLYEKRRLPDVINGNPR